jgi:hypothetical protein
MPPLRCMFIGGGHLRLTMRERRPCLCGRARRANPVLPTASGSERYRHSVAISGRGRECEASFSSIRTILNRLGLLARALSMPLEERRSRHDAPFGY